MQISEPHGFINMANRLKYRGGAAQQDRMIRDKRKTLDDAVLYSYQGARVRKLGDSVICPALINPNKLKPDYDDKVISIGFEYGFAPGTVFDWGNTGTKWLVYLQDLTELAYFKGDIRRCSYEVLWKDEETDAIETTYMAIQGPVETRIMSVSKNDINADVPNHSLHMLIPANEKTLKFFKRYAEFILDGVGNAHDWPEIKYTSWRVEGIDKNSMPGIIEITAVEYYINPAEDDIINQIAGGLIVRPVEPFIQNPIAGETFIRPKENFEYEYVGNEEGEWIIPKKAPIKVVNVAGKKITLQWLKVYSGQFTLQYASATKDIIVESLW